MPVTRTIRLEPQIKITAQQCNGCEKTMTSHEGSHHIEASGGYGSTYPPDTHAIEFVLCDSCLQKVVVGLRIPPTHSRYFSGVYWRGFSFDFTLDEASVAIRDPLEDQATGEFRIALFHQVKAALEAGYEAHHTAWDRMKIGWEEPEASGRFLLYEGTREESMDEETVELLCPHPRGVLRDAWQEGFTHSVYDTADTGLEEILRQAGLEEYAKREKEGWIEEIVHFEDPPGLGRCSCAVEQTWPCDGSVLRGLASECF